EKRGRKENQNWHGLQDVGGWHNQDLPAAVDRREIAGQQGDNERQDHRRNHPGNGSERVERKVLDVEIELRAVDRIDVWAIAEQDDCQSDDKHPDAEIYRIGFSFPHMRCSLATDYTAKAAKQLNGLFV